MAEHLTDDVDRLQRSPVAHHHADVGGEPVTHDVEHAPRIFELLGEALTKLVVGRDHRGGNGGALRRMAFFLGAPLRPARARPAPDARLRPRKTWVCRSQKVPGSDLPLSRLRKQGLYRPFWSNNSAAASVIAAPSRRYAA